MARRIPAIALLAIAAAGLIYALYMLFAPTELVLSDGPGGPETGRINCATGATSGGFAPSAADVRASCAEAEADEQQRALLGGAVTLVAGAAGGLLLRRRVEVLTPQ